MGAHGAGALFRVVGLQQQATLLSPEAVEGADDVLEMQKTLCDWIGAAEHQRKSVSRRMQ